MNLREKIYYYLTGQESKSARIFEAFTLLLNIIFCKLFILETYSFSRAVEDIFWIIEIGTAFFFIFELIIRVYSAKNRFKYILSIYNILDFIALLPTIILLIFGIFSVSFAIPFIKTIKVLKVLRILRFLRFFDNPNFFFGTIRVELLKGLRLLITVLIIFFISSGFFYHFEHEVNPNVETFGDAFYFSVVTLTTVGFGDITPKSAQGRFVTTIMIISGIILIPWQAGQIIKEWGKIKKRLSICKNCGLKYHEYDATYCKACGNIIYQEFDGH